MLVTSRNASERAFALTELDGSESRDCSLAAVLTHRLVKGEEVAAQLKSLRVVASASALALARLPGTLGEAEVFVSVYVD